MADTNDRAPGVHLLTLQATFQGHRPDTVISLLGDEDFGPNGKVICSMSSRGPFKLTASFDNYYSLLTDGSLDWEQISECRGLINPLDGGSTGLALKAIYPAFLNLNRNFFMSKNVFLEPKARVWPGPGPREEWPCLV